MGLHHFSCELIPANYCSALNDIIFDSVLEHGCIKLEECVYLEEPVAGEDIPMLILTDILSC